MGTCGMCGGNCNGKVKYNIDGLKRYICHKCIKRKGLFVCSSCGTAYGKSLMYRYLIDGKTICRSCFFVRYDRCDVCKVIYPIRTTRIHMMATFGEVCNFCYEKLKKRVSINCKKSSIKEVRMVKESLRKAVAIKRKRSKKVKREVK